MRIGRRRAPLLKLFIMLIESFWKGPRLKCRMIKAVRTLGRLNNVVEGDERLVGYEGNVFVIRFCVGDLQGNGVWNKVLASGQSLIGYLSEILDTFSLSEAFIL